MEKETYHPYTLLAGLLTNDRTLHICLKRFGDRSSGRCAEKKWKHIEKLLVYVARNVARRWMLNKIEHLREQVKECATYDLP